MDRVRVIERSLRCYTAGWWSLVPVFGLIPAGLAIYLYFRVRRETAGSWNPAAGPLGWGVLLALTGGGASLLLIGAATIRHLY